MTIGFRQGSVVTEIGPGGLLHSLFSTIAVHLEGGKWGARFPTILNLLYQGSLPEIEVDAALREFSAIKKGLELLSPDQIVWDIDAPGLVPPWGSQYGSHVTSMANYFVTTSGRNLVNELLENLESLKIHGGSLDIISYNGMPGFPAR